MNELGSELEGAVLLPLIGGLTELVLLPWELGSVSQQYRSYPVTSDLTLIFSDIQDFERGPGNYLPSID